MALYVLVVLSVCLLFCCGVQAISKQSDRRIPNDPHDLISVLPSSEDDDFDCVDIYKQPALSHPLLKNHKIQLYPRFSKRQIKSRSRVGSHVEVNDQSKGCPSGKVPIQRSKSNHQFAVDFAGRHFATIDTIKTTTFHGAAASIAINNPSVSADQYSMAQVLVQSGPTAELNSIQAGWAVHPELYGGDQNPRLTIRWTIDGFISTGCFNTECPGFVQVDPTIRPGQLFENISIPGGPQYLLDVVIYQEQESGKWWLRGHNGINVGYWPKELFNHLADGAAVVRYGGTTASDGAFTAQMGTGSFPSEDYNKGVGFFSNVEIAESNFLLTSVKFGDMSRNVDSSTKCYDLQYFGPLPNLGETFSYGGPGGDSCA